jgi:hypothetical protein
VDQRDSLFGSLAWRSVAALALRQPPTSGKLHFLAGGADCGPAGFALWVACLAIGGYASRSLNGKLHFLAGGADCGPAGFILWVACLAIGGYASRSLNGKLHFLAGGADCGPAGFILWVAYLAIGGYAGASPAAHIRQAPIS